MSHQTISPLIYGTGRRAIAASLALGLVFSATAAAQRAPSQAPLPLGEYGTTPDVPGAANRPDPAINYRVVFQVLESSGTREKNAGLVRVARFANTLAQHGVPTNQRNIAVVIYGPATTAIMNDAAFATRTGVAANPNTQLIKKLAAAGVKIHVCGQATRGMNITPDMQMREVTRDLSGTISLINYQARGYVMVDGR